MVKKPNVAGSFYPASAEELSEMLNKFISEAEKELNDRSLATTKTSPALRGDRTIPTKSGDRTFGIRPGEPKAIIVPHAGYIFSGKTAGFGFAALKQAISEKAKVKIVVIAPSHYAYLPGAATAEFSAFQTPLGEIPAKSLLSELTETKGIISNQSEAYEQEHALEVELPFLQKICANKDIVILPLLTGECNPAELATALKPLLEEENTFLVISSDLSHFYNQGTAQRIDAATCEAIQELNLEKIIRGEACGKAGILTLIHLAKELNWKPQQLYYDTSATASGDTSSVVGYASFAFLS